MEPAELIEGLRGRTLRNRSTFGGQLVWRPTLRLCGLGQVLEAVVGLERPTEAWHLDEEPLGQETGRRGAR